MNLGNVSFEGVRSEPSVSTYCSGEIDLTYDYLSGTAPGGIVGQSDAIRQVLKLVETVALSDSTVLLLGETGTGKELVARAIHERSRRARRDLVKVNCAAIPSGLLESELFGHERGAFTGAIMQKIGRLELADEGTLFLDEVGDIPLELQPKLLRVLQEREFERLGSTRTKQVNVRLVAATNCDLVTMMADKKFRSDLYYRLNVFPIRIPPLRERRDDIPYLVRHFVHKYARRMGKEIQSISRAAMRRLTHWQWPGNVRELENVIERAVILSDGPALEISDPSLSASATPPSASPSEDQDRVIGVLGRLIHRALAQQDDVSLPAVSFPSDLDRLASTSYPTTARFEEQSNILQALRDTNGRVGGPNGAAARMGIKRTTLITRMKKLGIESRRVF
jgi:formate hydrogenlyase transcriptional activator